MKIAATIAGALTLLFSTFAFASPPYQVADLRTKTATVVSTYPWFVGIAGGAAIFGSSQTAGYSLWRTDGNSAGTVRLFQSKSFPDARSIGGAVYFSADDNRLWRSDGTVEGTVALTSAGTPRLFPLAFAGERLVCIDDSWRELWSVDGAGGRRIGTISSQSTTWLSMGEYLGAAYIGTDSSLWRSDGTEGGTYQIASISAAAIVPLSDRIVFVGTTPDTGSEFWTSDGTQAGTHVVTDAYPGAASFASVAALTVVRNIVLFLRPDGSVGVTDGTPEGTKLLRSGLSVASPSIAVLGSTAYFPFDDGLHGVELWASDGTTDGTHLVRDSSSTARSISSLTAGATRVYYFGGDDAHSSTLFESDGTTEGTHAVDGRPDPSVWTGGRIVTVGDHAFYAGFDSSNGVEPWVTDGTAAGTRLIVNVTNEIAGSCDPKQLVGATGQIYFSGWSDDDVWKLWASGGTIGTTRELARASSREALPQPLLADRGLLYVNVDGRLHTIDPSTATDASLTACGSLTPWETTAVGGLVYAPGHSRDICVSDGTFAGTHLIGLRDYPTRVVSVAGQAQFLTSSGLLYVTDGSEAGTSVIGRADETYTIDSPLIPVAASSVFLEHTSDRRIRLWSFSKSLGEVIAESSPGTYESPAYATLASDALLFVWPLAKNQLWRTDGTASGTIMVIDFPGSAIRKVIPIGDRVLLSVLDSMTASLWVTDGTAAGTSRLHDFDFVADDPWTAAGSVAFFVAAVPEYGRELWRTDGTAAGTQLVSDIVPGTGTSLPQSLTVAGDTLFFSAETPSYGRELWAYDIESPLGLSIEDARAPESDREIKLHVRLSRAATGTIAFTYATEDATAHAGVDFAAANGTLVFTPGVTELIVTVPIVNDSLSTGSRYFRLRINSQDAKITRGSAAAVIDEDDRLSNVRLSLDDSGLGDPKLVVRNAGPDAALNVVYCYELLPYAADPTCSDPMFFAPGETRSYDIPFGNSWGTPYGYIGRATSENSDPVPSDNVLTFRIADKNPLLLMSPMHPFARSAGTLLMLDRLGTSSRGVHLASDHSTLLSVPESMTIAEGRSFALTSFAPLSAGIASVSGWVDPMYWYVTTLDMRVFADAIEAAKLPPRVELSGAGSWKAGERSSILAAVTGCTLDWRRPTGIVDFFDNGGLVSSASLSDQKAILDVLPSTGFHLFTASYRGDVNFLATAGESDVRVMVALATAGASIAPIPGTKNVSIVLHGTPGLTPTGNVTVEESVFGQWETRATGLSLDANGSDSASATVLAFKSVVSAARIVYSGDTSFEGSTWTLPIAFSGDANGDGAVDGSDVFYLVSYLFGGGAAPARNVDCNADGLINNSDLFFLINFLYAGGPPPEYAPV